MTPPLPTPGAARSLEAYLAQFRGDDEFYVGRAVVCRKNPRLYGEGVIVRMSNYFAVVRFTRKGEYPYWLTALNPI